MSTGTNTQVAVKYRQNIGSLSANNRTTTLGRHIDRHIGCVSVDISTDARPICWPIYRTTHLGRNIDQHSTDNYVDSHIDRHSADMSTDTSVDCRSICRPICQSRGAQNNPSKARSSNTENFEGGLEYSLHSFPQPHTGHFSDCLHLIPTIPRQVCKTTGSH